MLTKHRIFAFFLLPRRAKSGIVTGESQRREGKRNMEIRVLEYFLTVVREGSISKAAKVLHITQPTLSRQLAQLEDESGVRLFQRGARKIELTNEGILLRRRAEEILALVEKTERELALQEEQIEGVISIGSGETAAVQTLAKTSTCAVK